MVGDVKAAVLRPIPSHVASAPVRRRADVDWLRVVGMLLVFAVHAAEPFNPWDAWHISNPERSKWLGELVLFIAPWIMPLFMVLAGEGAWHALEKRSSRAYVRERLLRIGLPLAAGILLLVPPQVWLERRLQGRSQGSLVEFYAHLFDGIYPTGNLSWHHLWFLVFLLAFALVTLPLFQWLRGARGRGLMARLGAPCERAGGLAWLVLPAVAIRVGAERAFPGFPPVAYDWSSRTLLLPAFVFGFMVEGEPRLRRAVDRHWRPALGAALVTSTATLAWAWPGDVLARLPDPRSWAGDAFWAGYACSCWCWIVALRGAARRHLARDGILLRRASEMAYPFYVLHHGIIVAVAYFVVQANARALVAFPLLAGVSLAVTVALCVAVASSGALRMIFGLRRSSAG